MSIAARESELMKTVWQQLHNKIVLKLRGAIYSIVCVTLIWYLSKQHSYKQIFNTISAKLTLWSVFINLSKYPKISISTACFHQKTMHPQLSSKLQQVLNTPTWDEQTQGINCLSTIVSKWHNLVTDSYFTWIHSSLGKKIQMCLDIWTSQSVNIIIDVT